MQKAWKNGKLDPAKAEFLDKLGVPKDAPAAEGGMGADKMKNRSDTIAKHMKALAQYKKEHGDINVPWDHVSEGDLKLGLFMKGMVGKASSGHMPGPLRESMRDNFNMLGLNFESYVKEAAKEREKHIAENQRRRSGKEQRGGEAR